MSAIPFIREGENELYLQGVEKDLKRELRDLKGPFDKEKIVGFLVYRNQKLENQPEPTRLVEMVEDAFRERNWGEFKYEVQKNFKCAARLKNIHYFLG